jgi:hypothetical protein
MAPFSMKFQSRRVLDPLAQDQDVSVMMPEHDMARRLDKPSAVGLCFLIGFVSFSKIFNGLTIVASV